MSNFTAEASALFLRALEDVSDRLRQLNEIEDHKGKLRFKVKFNRAAIDACLDQGSTTIRLIRHAHRETTKAFDALDRFIKTSATLLEKE